MQITSINLFHPRETFMRKSLYALVIVTAGLTMASTANAACSRVSTKGTDGSKNGAMVQAWEAQLQARGWKGWMEFMGSGMKVGNAPGYKSSRIERSSCNSGELGVVCHVTATLCD
jgi:hypothetical protein